MSVFLISVQHDIGGSRHKKASRSEMKKQFFSLLANDMLLYMEALKDATKNWQEGIKISKVTR